MPHPGQTVPRDRNYVPALVATDSTDATKTVAITADVVTGRLLVAATVTGGGGDGAILDGSSSSIKATVKNYTNSNPLTVRLTDTNGDYVGAGAGTQYVNAVAQATPTGTVALGWDGANVRALSTTSAGALILSAETTKVIGTVRNSDGAGNLWTSNSTTYTAKFGQDSNLLGTLGTAFSTAGKVDVKGVDGDVFVRQTTAANLNATVVGTGTFVTQSTLAAETTKVIGVTRTADGSGNLLTSTTNALDINIKSSGASNISTNTAQMNGVTVLMGNGATGTGSQRVTIASDNTAVAGMGVAATGAAAPANAGYGGLIAKTANPTAATDGNLVGSLADKLGKQVVVGSIRDLKGNQFTTITSSTAETTVVTQVASTFLDVYGVIVENTSATGSKVTFKDSTSGTTQFEIYVPATDTRGFMLNESAAFKQTTVNTNWTATCGTSVASIVISVLFVKNT